MAKVKRKVSIAAAKASGQTKKQAGQTFRAQVKAANGGKTRMGRLIKGAVNIAASAVPGVGGVVAGALQNFTNKPKGEQIQEMVKQLPAFEQNQNDTAMNIGAGAMASAAQAASTAGAEVKAAPVVLLNTPPPILEPVKEEVKAQSIGTQATNEKATANNNAVSSGGGSLQDEGEQQQTRTSYAPITDSGKENDTPKAKKNKMWLIVAASVAVLVVVVVIIKATAKK